MADNQNIEEDVALADQPASTGDDVDMAEDAEAQDGEQPGDATELPFAEGGETDNTPRVTFMTYLSSPIITLIVGQGESATVLSAHQSLLAQSPWFARACNQFTEDGSPRQIVLDSDDVDAVGSFLEYLYTGDYFPRKVAGTRALEQDPSLPAVDESGEQLLRHARIYTLAEKFGIEKLKSLATSKIHCVNSTAKGEITYARYVYQYTTRDDSIVRAPIANFWATRSHTLRSEAEDEFRSLCLEFPEFGYDVLTRVLDEKLKREKNEKMHPATSSARKRARHSGV
ncbi:speckle-type POZ protein [Microdochium nivale]|nr:speckle-type POZ protein [Microdochium nivale]